MRGNINDKLSDIYLLSERVNNQNLELKAKRIDPSELKDSKRYDTRKCSRVTIQKKEYNTMEVACKPISTDDIKRVQNHLAILEKLDCQHIIQYRGPSKICEKMV